MTTPLWAGLKPPEKPKPTGKRFIPRPKPEPKRIRYRERYAEVLKIREARREQ